MNRIVLNSGKNAAFKTPCFDVKKDPAFTMAQINKRVTVPFNQWQRMHDQVTHVQETQRHYLSVQSGISRDLLALHQRLSRKIHASPSAHSAPTMLAKLTGHQQELQRIQERWLAIQQKQGMSALGLADELKTPAVSMEYSRPKNSALKKRTFVGDVEPPTAWESLDHVAESDIQTASVFDPLKAEKKLSPPAPLPAPFLRKQQHELGNAVPADDHKVPLQPPRPVMHPEDKPKAGARKQPVSLRHQLESTLFRGLRSWAGKASEAHVARAGSVLASLLYYVFRLRRQVVWSNLQLAYPELRVARKRRIAKGCYRWASRFALDVMCMENWGGRMEERTLFRNPEVLEEAYKKGKGVLLVGAHFGNWEVLCPTLSEKGYRTAMYVGAQTNPLTDELQNMTRRRWGIQTIGKGQQATMQIWDALRENRLVGMLIDQDERKSGVFVDFFGTSASTSRGAASFHLMNRSPVVLFGCPYVKRRVEVIFQPIDFKASGNQERDVRKLTQLMVSGLETMIRRYPEQYFWMHRRWRTRPPGETGRN